MTDLAVWLLEQITEDERDVRGLPSEWDHWMISPTRLTSRIRRVLAECEAKRRIIAECRGLSSGVLADDLVALLGDVVLAQLAAPYADRPGYREEWKP
jgi:hypothetical protein